MSNNFLTMERQRFVLYPSVNRPRLSLPHFLHVSHQSSLMAVKQNLTFTSVNSHHLLFLPDETEEEVRPLDSAKCPSPVQSTPWIPFQNACYNFMITKNRHKTVTPEEVQSMCKQLRKYALLPSSTGAHPHCTSPAMKIRPQGTNSPHSH